MKKSFIFFFVAPLLLLGCSTTSATRISGASGTPWVSISCKRSHSRCYERAGEECPYGYSVIDSSGRSGQYTQVNQYGGYSIPIYHGELIIECKPGHTH